MIQGFDNITQSSCTTDQKFLDMKNKFSRNVMKNEMMRKVRVYMIQGSKWVTRCQLYHLNRLVLLMNLQQNLGIRRWNQLRRAYDDGESDIVEKLKPKYKHKSNLPNSSDKTQYFELNTYLQPDCV